MKLSDCKSGSWVVDPFDDDNAVKVGDVMTFWIAGLSYQPADDIEVVALIREDSPDLAALRAVVAAAVDVNNTLIGFMGMDEHGLRELFGHTNYRVLDENRKSMQSALDALPADLITTLEQEQQRTLAANPQMPEGE